MQRIILVYGTLAGVIVIAAMALSMTVGDHGTLGMVLGFLSMFIALSMVFVGVKRYRDEHLGGAIRFWKALGVGLGISAIGCLFYVLGWEVYMWATDYTFMEKYMQLTVAKMQADGASAAEIAAFNAEATPMVEAYKDPIQRMLITLMEISIVALFVPLVSAALLRNPRFMPAKV